MLKFLIDNQIFAGASNMYHTFGFELSDYHNNPLLRGFYVG